MSYVVQYTSLPMSVPTTLAPSLIITLAASYIASFLQALSSCTTHISISWNAGVYCTHAHHTPSTRNTGGSGGWSTCKLVDTNMDTDNMDNTDVDNKWWQSQCCLYHQSRSLLIRIPRTAAAYLRKLLRISNISGNVTASDDSAMALTATRITSVSHPWSSVSKAWHMSE